MNINAMKLPIPWTGVINAYPECYMCTWAWRDKGYFELKYRNNWCAEHRVSH